MATRVKQHKGPEITVAAILAADPREDPVEEPTVTESERRLHGDCAPIVQLLREASCSTRTAYILACKRRREHRASRGSAGARSEGEAAADDPSQPRPIFASPPHERTAADGNVRTRQGFSRLPASSPSRQLAPQHMASEKRERTRSSGTPARRSRALTHGHRLDRITPRA
jgi:hypothetical protein